MELRYIKTRLKKFMGSPLHPQWLTSKRTKMIEIISSIAAEKRVLDVGCFDKWISKHMKPNVHYIGLDYLETSQEWYFTKPDVFGDAHRLPFAEKTFDYIFLLDVVEHLENTNLVLDEASRVLKDEGKVVIQIPFLYPVHDAPRDFQRLTSFGMSYRAESAGMKVTKCICAGTPIQTACLLLNISVANLFYKLFTRRNPLAVLVAILPLFFLSVNCIAWLDGFISEEDDFMPFSYIFVLEKIPREVRSL